MATRAERARSFGSIAADYDRLRPGPAPAALDWLIPDGCETAVDLAAGTGLLTRALAERIPHVIAVEPDPQMRAVLSAKSPEVDVVDGLGEAIPLPDAIVDALFISSAWHWLDPERAVPEIARVLKDGGRFGVLRSGRDREIDWVHDLDRLPQQRHEDGAAADRERQRREVLASDEGEFVHVDRRLFNFTRRMTIDDVVELTATYSGVITAPAEEREVVLSTARANLHDRFPGQSEVDFPMRTWCWRADRVPR
ncbi:MAG TPA: class I SAM-dependent methyltransferase [Mycobacteriales bacterium]|nr:class I SAM-dependent methyltransferase [Mycobacteriales bacterium]